MAEVVLEGQTRAWGEETAESEAARLGTDLTALESALRP